MKDMWNERFSEEDYAYGMEANDFLKTQLSKLPENSKVLCIADGQGRNSLFLAKNNMLPTAVDFSEVGIQTIQKIAKDNNVTIETFCEDLNTFEMGIEKWDAIVSIFAHLPLSIREHVHHKIEKALKKNGLLILEGYAPEQLNYNTGGPKNLEMLFTIEQIEKDFSTLRPILLQKITRDIHEGKYHNGTSVVIQFVGRK